MSVVSDTRSSAPAPADAAPRSERSRPGTATHFFAVVGVALVVAGGLLPWLVVFNGLTTVPGFRLGGGAPAAVTVAAAGFVLLAVHRGGAWLRWAAVLGSAASAAYVAYLANGILGFVADPGPSGVLLMPHAGPGAYVMVVGSVCVLVAALVARPAPGGGLATLPLAIAGLTYAAGCVHLLLAPEHLEEHPILGIGFVLAGIAQVALAVLVAVRPGLTALSLVVALNVAIMAVYLYAVVVGLPFGDSGMADMPGMAGMPGMDMGDMADHADGWALGAGEPVDVIGATTFVAELLGVGLVLAQLRQISRRPV